MTSTTSSAISACAYPVITIGLCSRSQFWPSASAGATVVIWRRSKYRC
jgi:hypothetical protein